LDGPLSLPCSMDVEFFKDVEFSNGREEKIN
jgi:hypothetical protein